MKLDINLFSYLTVIALLIIASIIDVRERRIPNRLVLLGTVLGVIYLFFGVQGGLMWGLWGGVTAGMIMLLAYALAREGLGLGDVKLFGCTGIYLGLEGVISAMASAALLSGVYSTILICVNHENKNREIPFAPFILAGTVITIIF